MIKEFIFKRKVIRFFKRLASLRAFGYCTYENRHFDDRYPMRITKPWQLDVIEELDACEAFKSLNVKYPGNRDEWTDLKMVLSLITHNKTIRLSYKSCCMHNARMYFGMNGFEIYAYDEFGKITGIRMETFFRELKCESDNDTTTYKLSAKEQERQSMFNKIHCHCGGNIETIFVPYNISVRTRMRCTGCGEETEITDADSGKE